jgi:hypothetical protein
VSYAGNHSYSGGRDQEDHGLKTDWPNISQDSVLKIPITKRAGRVVKGKDPEFKTQNHTKKK